MTPATLPLIVVLVLAPTAAHAEIFTCSGKAGMTIYQNFPCEFDSLGSLPTPSSKSATTVVPARSAQAKPTSVGSERRTTVAQSNPAPAAPRVGMTTDQVKAIWGEPADKSAEEPADGDIEIWTYADSRSIQFDRKGRVTAFRW
jgi:hypothetical protein